MELPQKSRGMFLLFKTLNGFCDDKFQVTAGVAIRSSGSEIFLTVFVGADKLRKTSGNKDDSDNVTELKERRGEDEG